MKCGDGELKIIYNGKGGSCLLSYAIICRIFDFFANHNQIKRESADFQA